MYLEKVNFLISFYRHFKIFQFYSHIEKLEGKYAVDAINIPGLKTVMNK